MEAVEVTFDPRRISYEELLDVFWGMFPANVPPGPSRVRTAVLPRGEAQRAAAAASKRRLGRRLRDRVYTEIVPAAAFWPAERMHQKFNLQRVHPELVRELAAPWPDADAFLESTAAARLNAWVSGFADDDALAEAAAETGWTVEDLRRRLATPGDG
jgi:peptide-methionine (S)-S-oxide reductase